MGFEAQLARKCLFTSIFFGGRFCPHKVGPTNLVLVCNKGLLVGLCSQDYKSLYGALTLCTTVVNIQTDTQTAF